MIEKEAFARRQAYSDKVYSSATWPPNQPMCMHHELSYRLEVPSLMLFACLDAPTRGGATAVSDSPTVLDALPKHLTERFERDGWILTAATTTRSGRPWRGVRTGRPRRHRKLLPCQRDRVRVAARRLRTWQRRPVVRHPMTGKRCFFNQIAFLNEWTIDPEVREYLVDMYGADGLPFNTRFGQVSRLPRTSWS